MNLEMKFAEAEYKKTYMEKTNQLVHWRILC